MAKKALKKTANVLGGLGAAYALTRALGSKDEAVDPAAELRMGRDIADFSSRPRIQISDAEQAERVREGARRRDKLPLVTDAEQAEIFKGIPGVRSETGVPIRSGDGLLQTQTRKKGGTVKGWGAARGARKAKVY